MGHGPNPRLKPGMVLAIEPMVNLGIDDVDVLDDDWTVVTGDRQVSAHFEHYRGDIQGSHGSTHPASVGVGTIRDGGIGSMRRLRAIHLLVTGMVAGIVISVLFISCSTNDNGSAGQSRRPGPTVRRPRAARDLQESFRAVSRSILPSVVRIDVEEVRTQSAPQGDDTPWFDFFFW